jgi:hypothetical protein
MIFFDIRWLHFVSITGTCTSRRMKKGFLLLQIFYTTKLHWVITFKYPIEGHARVEYWVCEYKYLVRVPVKYFEASNLLSTTCTSTSKKVKYSGPKCVSPGTLGKLIRRVGNVRDESQFNQNSCRFQNFVWTSTVLPWNYGTVNCVMLWGVPGTPTSTI